MTFALSHGPRRIVCLTEEPTEILYALGEQDRIVGISAYTERPPEARRDKPVVSAFIGGSVRKIRALDPDLVIGFSDIQADLARDLIRANLPVLIFNQRSIQQILDVVLDLGRLVNQRERAEALVHGYIQRLERAAQQVEPGAARPRVYFEEWDEPMISAIEWVSELIQIAGGRNVFAARAPGKLARDRFVTAEEVVREDPEVVLASWCGKPFDRQAFEARPGFSTLSAVQAGRVFEVPSAIILQPGPACLTDGLDFLVRALSRRA
ncbi:MAG TPA: cobalamin-binding protein [Polyangiaceae bacterium]|nr:cobalamin-binding protein [Polyangiaceae bacterium]